VIAAAVAHSPCEQRSASVTNTDRTLRLRYIRPADPQWLALKRLRTATHAAMIGINSMSGPRVCGNFYRGLEPVSAGKRDPELVGTTRAALVRA
jgi:hypothetical protein